MTSNDENFDNRSGKRRRARDEAYFGYCTVEDEDYLGYHKSPTKHDAHMQRILE